MRLYLDQMMRCEVAVCLREEGHDVVRAEETGEARADDAAVLATACHEDRILVTMDEHFGDWVVLPLRRHAGVIRLKVHPPLPHPIVNVLIPFLAAREPEAFRNTLVILSPKRARWIKTSD